MDERKLTNEVSSIEVTNILDDINMQTKIIRLYVDEDSKFREETRDIIKTDYFESNTHKVILKYIIKYIDKYEMVPTTDALKITIKSSHKNKKEVDRLSEFVDDVYNFKIDEREKQFVFDVSIDYFKKKYLKKILFKAAEQFDINSFSEISSLITNSIKKFEPKSKAHDYARDVEKRMEQKKRNPIGCLSGLNQITNGGLSAGELGIVCARTGGGKSMMLVRFGAEGIKLGKKVLYVTLELAQEAVGLRFDACLNDLQMQFLVPNKTVIKENAERFAASGGRLIIQQYLDFKPTVSTLKSLLSTLKRDYEGFVPDVIIVDYADLMKPTVHYSEKRHALTDIYEGLRNFGNEVGCPIWTASQVNRAGYGGDADDKRKQKGISLSNIAEDIGKANTADLIIAIERTAEQMKRNQAKMGILKNRNGREGDELDMIFDTYRCKMEISAPRVTGKPNLDGLTTVIDEEEIKEMEHDLEQMQ